MAENNAIRIILKTYREAEQTDWENLVGQGARFNFNHIHFDLRGVRAAGKVLSESDPESAEYIKAYTERVNLTEIISTQVGNEYTMEEWIQSEQQEERLDLLKLKKDDLIEIHLAGVRKDLLKKRT